MAHLCVKCGKFWYFDTLSACQVLIADHFGIFRTLSGVNCEQFWSFGTIPMENENYSNLIRPEFQPCVSCIGLHDYTNFTTITIDYMVLNIKEQIESFSWRGGDNNYL